ncbi:hypothetical protein [Tatumella saanichensis]|uniref:hypothetical protein n=1 Tax=Tatumella saanichensis TaxID=480813 RepID=UPI0012680B5C|nr:hypothetical protein [Tatumella saanichensis]
MRRQGLLMIIMGLFGYSRQKVAARKYAPPEWGQRLGIWIAALVCCIAFWLLLAIGGILLW